MAGPEELPVHFGAEDALFGIVTRAASAENSKPRPGVVFLNAGVIHRVGPHRMHVLLARRLAREGFATMRIDLSGLGDSKAARGETSFHSRAVTDARAAMDRMTSLVGASRFVLFGLCSGADNGLATALEDDRVAGVVMLDPFTYVTRRAIARKLEAKVRSLGTPAKIAEWGLSVGARKLRAFADARSSRAVDGRLRTPLPVEPDTQSGREAPTVEEFGDRLRKLLARRVAVLALYSGALGERYNHEDQLFELFPDLRGRVDRAWFPEANHTFTPLDVQRAMFDTTSSWLARTF